MKIKKLLALLLIGFPFFLSAANDSSDDEETIGLDEVCELVGITYEQLLKRAEEVLINKYGGLPESIVIHQTAQDEKNIKSEILTEENGQPVLIQKNSNSTVVIRFEKPE